MSERSWIRERHAWIAAVAVLATSSAWLAGISGVLLLRSPELEWLRVVARVLARAGLSIAPHGWPIVPVALLSTGVAALLARALGRSLEERTHHA